MLAEDLRFFLEGELSSCLKERNHRRKRMKHSSKADDDK